MAIVNSLIRHVDSIRGIRYDAGYAHTHPVLCPPYDVLNEAGVARLYEMDPHNVVRIELGLDQPDDVAGHRDRYTRAAAYLCDWLQCGVLEEDGEPAAYLLEHRFPEPDGSGPRVRRGLFCGLEPADWSAGWIRPHERTFSTPKADRLKLLQATGVETSPVFAMWNEINGVDSLLADVAHAEPDLEVSFEGELGTELLTMWKVGDSGPLQAITGILSRSALYIADGHHRFETASAFIRDARNGEGTVLAYLCAASDPGLRILPTHRMVRAPHLDGIRLDDVSARLGPGWQVAICESTDELAPTAEQSGFQTITVIAGDGVGVLSRPVNAGLPRAQTLSVSALHDAILPALADGRRLEVSFTRSEQEALEEVGAREAGLAFLLPPCTSADIMAVADAGDVMPHKSTYFYPKVPTGLVMARI